MQHAMYSTGIRATAMEIKIKYDIGDMVWTIEGDRAICFEIRGVEVKMFRFPDGIFHTAESKHQLPRCRYGITP